MTPPPDRPRTKWYYRPWFVLLMLGVFLGPLALPLLWKSPQFPTWLKIVLSLLMVAYIAWFIAFVVHVVELSSARYDQLDVLFR